MDQEKERQLTMLQEIYDNWTPPTPAFKAHHEGVPEGMVPYISSSDVDDYKYNIPLFQRTSSCQKMMASTRRWKKEQSSLTMNRWRSWWLMGGFWTEPQS